MTTLAIVFPGPLGYHVFVRWPRDRLRRCSTLVDASDLAGVLGSLGPHSSGLALGPWNSRPLRFDNRLSSA